ncbi:DUF551 domain-containing protein [Escherichia coli]|uniref:DUF551 domain-containing protein n=1 Tax=Escherichia coli TaxID=562 RepID=UPI001260C4B4|nr:DUF551 domain-containing protein [Escherichia coli]
MTTMNREEQKQVLIDTANHIINRDNTSPYSENLRELARIALASLEAEPVGAFHIAEQQVDGTSDYLKDGEWPIDNGIIEVYAAPPAPVSVPAAMEIDDDFDSAFEHGKAVGWNAYRAAMLQAEPVSNSDELPLDYLQGHKDGLEWAAQLAEANHPQTGDWLYDDPIDLARAIRKGPDMPTVQGGNSPVAQDGLLGCGENCWSCGKYFTYEQHSECDGYCPHCNSPVDLDDEEDQPSKVVPTNPTEEMISNAWREAIGKCDHETIKRIYATMLAAAPQQEVK